MVVVDIRYQTERSARIGSQAECENVDQRNGRLAYQRISTEVRGLGTKIESPS